MSDKIYDFKAFKAKKDEEKSKPEDPMRKRLDRLSEIFGFAPPTEDDLKNIQDNLRVDMLGIPLPPPAPPPEVFDVLDREELLEVVKITMDMLDRATRTLYNVRVQNVLMGQAMVQTGLVEEGELPDMVPTDDDTKH